MSHKKAQNLCLFCGRFLLDFAAGVPITIFSEAHEMIKRTLLCLALCGLMVSGSLMAHHSLAGVYDMKGDMEKSGSVESVKFVNPHGSLTITVKNPDGTSTSWVMT